MREPDRVGPIEHIEGELRIEPDIDICPVARNDQNWLVTIVQLAFDRKRRGPGHAVVIGPGKDDPWIIIAIQAGDIDRPIVGYFDLGVILPGCTFQTDIDGGTPGIASIAGGAEEDLRCRCVGGELIDPVRAGICGDCRFPVDVTGRSPELLSVELRGRGSLDMAVECK